MTHRIGSITLFVAFLGAAACSDNTPAETRSRLETILPGLEQDVTGASTGAQSGAAVTAYQQSMASLNTTFAALPFRFPYAATATAKLAVNAVTSGGDTTSSLEQILFNEESYEGDGVFRLRGDKICAAGDTVCIEKVDQAQIRVKVTLLDDGGIRFTLLVGADRFAPLVVTLQPHSLTVSVDLAQLKGAIQSLAAVTGTSVNLPEVMEGELHATITRNGPKDVSFSAGIGKDVRVQATVAQGPVSLAIAAADPIIRLHLDGNAQTLDGALALGEVLYSAPWQMVKPGSLATGTYALDLKGLSAAATVTAGDPTLRITGIGLGGGTSTVKYNDVTVLALDLDPNDGRRFDLEVSPVAGEMPTFGFAPALRGAVRVFFQPLAQLGDPVPAGALDETYTFDLGTLLQPYSGGVRVLQGPLTIAAVKAGASVTVASGQCLVASPLAAGEQPIIGLFAAAACP